MDDDREWSRIEQELRRQPAVNRVAIAGIMTAINRSRRQSLTARLWAWMAEPRLSLSPIGALAAAALIAVAAAGGARRAFVSTADSATRTPVAEVLPVTRALPAPAGALRQDVQFVLVADSASDVSIVGDFNDWDARATPLSRSKAGGVWSVVVPLNPGRHVYAFVIDGKQWTTDAAAPRAPENEFGTRNSIVMVGGST